MHVRRSILVLALLLAPFAVVEPAAQPVQLAPESEVWIDGTSTLGSFRCATQALRLSNQPDGLPTALYVATRSLDCGREAMNADLHRALAADVHPELRFLLRSVRILATAPGERRVLVHGMLSIAGQERAVAIRADVHEAAPGRLVAEGRQALRMSDFGITPPAALWGLVRAHDTVVIGFSLHGRLDADVFTSRSRAGGLHGADRHADHPAYAPGAGARP